MGFFDDGNIDLTDPKDFGFFNYLAAMSEDEQENSRILKSKKIKSYNNSKKNNKELKNGKK